MPESGGSVGSLRLDECFLDQVRERPDAVAVCGDTTLTYRELADRATAVAAGLQRLGVTRETLVGMAFPRGVDAVVAAVGITLAGGAYVPISPAAPGKRIGELLADNDIGIVVAADAGLVQAVAPEGVEVAGLSRVEAWGSGTESVTAPPPLDERSPLAHVLFTSGSTGKPKGVLIEHAGIFRVVREPEFLAFGPDDHVLHASPLEFDAATMEIWGALLNGARLCIVGAETVVVPVRFAAALREHRVTWAFVTSALFNQLVDDEPAIFAPLGKVFTGGDVVSPRHLELVRAHSPGLALHAAYGPTENTIFTTVHPIDAEPGGPVPLGRPLGGTTVLVLDEHGVPVAPGVIGELCTGGSGVARGYLNRPELTAERFVDVDGVRYYRTGDQARQDADGLLHFHGRVDGQVKIRGHRIEIAEVITALYAVPGVRDAYAQPVGDTVQDKRLVAYLVAPDTDEAAVRAELAAALPDYLVPDQFLWLDRLPLNVNGKVDTARLPAPGAARAKVRHTEAEGRLAELWGEVLGLPADTIGPAEDFLAIGGSSLKLGALLGKLDRRLGVRLGYAEALRARTLAGMTAALDGAATGHAPPIPEPAPGTRVPLHPRQLALYAHWAADPDSVAYNVPVRLRLRGPLDPARLRRAVRALAGRHDALRMTFVLAEGGVRQVAAPGTGVAFEVLDAPVPDVPARFVRPFRLDAPPLLRALLVPAGPGGHDLYLDTHHIVLDGLSLRVLVADLLDLYLGEEPAPAPSFAGAAKWCHDRGDDPAAEAFWLAELAGPPTADLPLDRPRGTRRATAGAVARRELPASELARVEEAARQAGTTPFTAVLTAYVAALARRTGEHDFVIGTPTSGRTAHPDLDRVVGMFANVVGLRAKPAEGGDLGGLLRDLDDRRAAALSYPDHPAEPLARRLGIARDPARNALFDAVFAYQDLEFYEFAKGGLEVSAELVNPGTTRYDLNLQAYRRPDRLVLDLEYATALFDRDSAEHLLDECLRALAELAADPRTPVFRTAPTTATPAERAPVR
ncbi:amino acid adenylation domain-containing protein [Amycolatopsis eburnea]|uniref:Amino acid adenylation domain-containing protein n=1 Tax=Amycolatopsis eburnea TaxID=2267691 RepID=A0A427SUP6_9PSEU|nr:amino acid adenylation domain-containing protein [Amycolatopsis eburnea]